MTSHSPDRVLLIPERNSLYLAFRLPRLFREAGLEVELWCEKGAELAHSGYVDAVVEFDHEEDLVLRLKTAMSASKTPWKAITIADERLVRRMVEESPAFCQRQFGGSGVLAKSLILSKSGLAEVSSDGALKTPPSRVCSSWPEVIEFSEEIDSDLFLKSPCGSAGHGVRFFAKRSRVSGELSPMTFPVLAQQFLRGRRGVVDMLCSQGKPLAWLASYSTKKAGGEFGPSTARSFRSMPDLAPLVSQVAVLTRFEGFCGFDWIEDESNGVKWLIEFHPRPPSGVRFGRFCQVDFARAIRAWVNGQLEGFQPLVQPSGQSVEAHYFTVDFFRCLRERDWRGLAAWLPGSGAVHDAFFDDMPLLSAWVAQRLSALRQREKAMPISSHKPVRNFISPLESDSKLPTAVRL